MQTWKTKRKATRKVNKKWKIRVLAAVMLVATLSAAVFDFPTAWNTSSDWISANTGWNAPQITDEPFRLGLDLQGGTHLVYEADMSQIPEEDRIEALEGVKDVIERRVNAFGVSEPKVQTTSTGGTHRVIVELAGVLDVNEAIKQIGETPVLEFKEPGTELEREATEEEQATLVALNKEERQAAEDVLSKARSRDADFDALVEEYSIELNSEVSGGRVDHLTENSGVFIPIVEYIENNNLRQDRVAKDLIETSEGFNIVKNTGEDESPEMLLSHILICFEGKTGCENPISAIEASVQINNIIDQATPENFAELAKEFSSDKSGEGDGDLGWIGLGATVPAFELAAQTLEVDDISGVVETEFGYHVILKRDERTVASHSIQRILMPFSNIYDVVPEVSPWKNTELSGKNLEHANVEFDQNTGQPYVALSFDSDGGDLFGKLTADHVGEQIAIFLDGNPISVPRVSQAIYGGQAIIQGNFSLEEAKILSQRLNAGALPVPVELLSQQTIGPTLGAISLERSVTAALIGFLLVALFMIAVYRLPGVIAVMALVFYAFLNLAAYRFFGVTITLASIAGFVLSLGIAVDANVLIIERFKEELYSGRDFGSAIDEGFKRAWTAIRDGNITTLIAAGVLYWFSSSFIRGFALTLSIGVILSMFTAIWVTRIYIKNILDIRWLRNHWLFAVKKKNKE